jgi:hypothetical protein
VRVARQSDQSHPGRGDRERDEPDPAPPLRQEHRREHGEKDRCRVDEQDGDRDRGALERLEEEHPVECEQEAETGDLRALPPGEEHAYPAHRREERGKRERREQTAPEDECLPGEVDACHDHGHEAPRGGEGGDEDVPPVPAHGSRI